MHAFCNSLAQVQLRKNMKLRRVNIVQNAWADDLNMKMRSACFEKEGEEKRKEKEKEMQRGLSVHSIDMGVCC